MGQKVHPTGIRLGIVKDHNSLWYADRNKYAEQLVTDIEVRAFIEKKLDNASVSRVVIERPAQTARITIHTARPGIVIGKKGEDVDNLRKVLAEKMGVPYTSISRRSASRTSTPASWHRTWRSSSSAGSCSAAP
jgi:small subunit ribosomal protein S3